MRFRDTPAIVVKLPPNSTLPSDCDASADTGPFVPVPGLNSVSRLPSEFRRAM